MTDQNRPMSSADISQTSENYEAALPKSLDEPGAIHETEQEQHDEPAYKEMQQTIRPPTRTNASSFAAPTRASEAKKNEKVELAHRPGSAMRQHSTSGFGSRPQSRQRWGVSTPMEDRGGEDEVDDEEEVNDVDENEVDVDNDDSSQFDSDVEDEGSGEEEGEEEENRAASILEGKELEGKPLGKKYLERNKLEEEELEKQAQEKVSEPEEELTTQEEGQPYDLEDLLAQEEPQENHVEDSNPDVQELQQRESPLTQDDTAPVSQEDHVKNVETQVAAPQDRIESTSSPGHDEGDKNNVTTISEDVNNVAPAEIVAKVGRLEVEIQKVEEQRDEAMKQRETVQQELVTAKEHAEKLKQERDELSDQLREGEAKIAARNAREPGLPPLEAVEAENKTLRMAINTTKSRLKENEIELRDARETCKQLDDNLTEAEEKIKNNEESIRTLYEIVDKIAENLPEVANFPDSELDGIFQSMGQDTEIGRLRANFLKLIKRVNGNSRELKKQKEDLNRQLVEERFENARLEKAMDIERTGLLSPGSQSPRDMHMSKNEWEQYYKRERQRRQGVEQELAKAKKQLSQLQPENEKLQSDLTMAEEELAELRPKNDKLEMEAKGWREELEENKVQFEQRSLAFETNISEQQRENFRYIRDYYKKVKDQAHWEVRGLQQKLSVAERASEALKRDYKREQVVNIRLEDAIIRLRKSIKARDIHIAKTEQAFMREAPFPIRSPSTSGSRTPNSNTSSSTSTSSISDWTHPLDRINRPPPIPRCHLPAAIQAREARMKTYKQELEGAREAEVFMLNVRPHESTAKGGSSTIAIMEQVRKRKMGSLYPAGKTGWADLRWNAVWERWDGNDWAREYAKGKEVDFLRKVGLWREDWD
ncbi:hypothetical protein J4E91_007504 [Alternaria rosae]|nr:hypothetical protein J4E91_007504 [Alternaria rosae]